MMLPILISVSLAPVSYFFCASEGEARRPRRPKESASFRTRCDKVKLFRVDGFAQHFMGFPLWAERDGCRRRLPQVIFSCEMAEDSSRTCSPEAMSQMRKL